MCVPHSQHKTWPHRHECITRHSTRHSHPARIGSIPRSCQETKHIRKKQSFWCCLTNFWVRKHSATTGATCICGPHPQANGTSQEDPSTEIKLNTCLDTASYGSVVSCSGTCFWLSKGNQKDVEHSRGHLFLLSDQKVKVSKDPRSNYIAST